MIHFGILHRLSVTDRWRVRIAVFCLKHQTKIVAFCLCLVLSVVLHTASCNVLVICWNVKQPQNNACYIRCNKIVQSMNKLC